MAAARDFTEELVGQAGFGVGYAGEDGEGVVEAGREDAGGEGEPEEEGVGGLAEVGAEDLGVDLLEMRSGGGGGEGGDDGGGGGGGVGRDGRGCC